MSEFEDRLNSILNDPAEMEKITRLASELMGGGGAQGTAPQEVSDADSEMFGRIAALLGSTSGRGDKSELLHALTPYLRPARQAKLKKALRLAKMAKLAAAAFGDGEGERNV